MKTNNILNDFTLIKNNITKKEDIDIEQYGEYRLGLTFKEVEFYIKAKCSLPQYKNKFKNIKKTIIKFWNIAGINTTTINSNGESLIYRNDIERFAGVLFNRIPTYFD